MNITKHLVRALFLAAVSAPAALGCAASEDLDEDFEGEALADDDDDGEEEIATTSDELSKCGAACAVTTGTACAAIPGGVAGAPFCAFAGYLTCEHACKHREPKRMPVARATRCLRDLLPGRSVTRIGTKGTFWTYRVTGGHAAVSYTNAGPRRVIVSWKLDGGRNVRPASPAPC